MSYGHVDSLLKNALYTLHLYNVIDQIYINKFKNSHDNPLLSLLILILKLS